MNPISALTIAASYALGGLLDLAIHRLRRQQPNELQPTQPTSRNLTGLGTAVVVSMLMALTGTAQ